MTSTSPLLAAFDAAVARYNGALTDGCDLDEVRSKPLERFMLVELNVSPHGDDGYFISLHPTEDAALHYNMNQDCAEDWELQAVHDLQTGSVLEWVGP